MANKIGTLSGENSRDLWNAVKLTTLGNSANHTTKQNMSLRLPDGSKAKNDKENMSVMKPHCEKLFNNHNKSISPAALTHIRQRDYMPELDEPISHDEIRTAIHDLKNNKSPGANGTPAEAFKALNARNRDHIHTIISGFWDGTQDYPDWHTGTGTPIPKTTHADDPNQFRIINLMDVCSKIFSRILTARTYKILEKHGTQNQFGATRNVGCQDGNFTLKTLVHLRRQHNQETYVVFADLVKAFDTSNHDLIINILKKFGAPSKFCNTIERLYSNLSVSLKIGKEEATIPQTIGVRQGDNLSPVIFLLIMAAFAEILEAKWTIAKIDKGASTTAI